MKSVEISNIPFVTIDGDRYISSPAAAELLGVANETMASMRCRCKTDGIDHPDYIQRGHRVFYLLDSLDEFVRRKHGSWESIPKRNRHCSAVSDGQVLLTPRQLMERWNVGRARFYQMCKQPGFPRTIKMGRGNRYHIDDIAAFEGSGQSLVSPHAVSKRRVASMQSTGAAHEVVVDDASKALTGKRMLTEKEIVAAATCHVKRCGIYFLVKANEVVYIGQSVDVITRIGVHQREKDFDRFAYIECSRESLDTLESLYIHYLQPRMNGETKGIKMAPLSLDQLVLNVSQVH